jgi:MerR family transcriptional regulator, repressor of the yfmOP operon
MIARGNSVTGSRRRAGHDGRGTHVQREEAMSASDELVARGSEPSLRIGEVAKLTGLTTRTLRYWEEIGLITPSAYRGSGERMYAPEDAARASRIRELQNLLGFSLAEVRMVLETEDVIHQLKAAFEVDHPSDVELLQMLDEAIEASDRLMARLDDTLARVHAFRDERAATAARLRSARVEMVARTNSEAPLGAKGPA